MSKFLSRLPKLAVVAVVAVGLGRVAWTAFAPATATVGGIVVPALTTAALAGKTAFDANCAQCHGAAGSGTAKGPPLIHRIYNPGHHADEAFYRAVKNGTPQHHWQFGNMPAQPQVSQSDVTAIIAYVREIQRANGITYEEHRM